MLELIATMGTFCWEVRLNVSSERFTAIKHSVTLLTFIARGRLLVYHPGVSSHRTQAQELLIAESALNRKNPILVDRNVLGHDVPGFQYNSTNLTTVLVAIPQVIHIGLIMQ